MEVRSDTTQPRSDKLPPPPKPRLQVWFVTVYSAILVWTCLVQLFSAGELWHTRIFTGLTNHISRFSSPVEPVPLPRPLPPPRNYTSNGILVVSCNGGLNQMRSAICDMVAVARLLNLTLVVPELDKTSFWADPSGFEDIFDVRHFIDSLRDEVRIFRRLPKRYTTKYGYLMFHMPPVSWSDENYYLKQILPLFSKHKVVHFSRTDTRLANNGLPLSLQRLRCRVNFQGLKFTPQLEALGSKLVRMIQQRGPFVALHLRYEMDMLAFSGCTHGCSEEEAAELKKMRYTYPWWREKEIVSEERRAQGMCPLTPEEVALVLKALGFDTSTQIYIAAGEIYGSERRLSVLREAFPRIVSLSVLVSLTSKEGNAIGVGRVATISLGFDKNTQIYIAAGEIYGSEHRLSVLREAFPRIVKKEMLLESAELQQFQNHSSQMAALDFMVSVASNTFIPTYDGNMAKVVEGHRRYLGFKKTILLDRKRLVELLDLHHNKTLTWDQFAVAVKVAHERRTGAPTHRRVISDKPKEEDYFYANPQECLCEGTNCHDLFGDRNYSLTR